MKTSFRMLDPEKMNCTMTMTMKLEEWQELEKQLVNQYQSLQLSHAISDMVSRANQTFCEEHHVTQS